MLGAFLDTATEREFDAPLMALLATRGFTDIHFLHGQFEFGKDFVAKGYKEPYGDVGHGNRGDWLPHQFSLQSKAGDIGLGAWQAVRLQLDSARLTSLAHPGFDANLPRTGVLITTGRLKGGAPVEAQNFREQERAAGRPDVEVWDRETLLDWLIDAPEAALAGAREGQLLTVIGAIDGRQVSVRDLERYSRSWLPPIAGSLEAATAPTEERRLGESRALVEAAVLANRLRTSGRLDLAAYIALDLLRASWVYAINDGQSPSTPSAHARAALRMFTSLSSELLSSIEPALTNPANLLSAIHMSPLSPSSYAVACSRFIELIGLVALLSDVDDQFDAELVRRAQLAIKQLISFQPGTSHPVSDGFAVSLLAPTLALARIEKSEAIGFIERVAVWLCDRYDARMAGIGLSPANEAPIDEITHLLGGPYSDGPQKRSGSYIASVLLDLCVTINPRGATFADLLNDFSAVGIAPEFRRADERLSHWRPDGAGVRFYSNMVYTGSVSEGEAVAVHHGDIAPIPAWHALAMASVVRDRHYFSVLHSLL
ncbi:hypothetical protein [Nakamurella leprariae]|uniref:Uncharacterized protein n=1 Tax=Nakamurella leprariae TaxID=2803911 RepID=A0A938YGK6_9ACTN|nr:hypothetical protein [Nakamurella leprariae]MBM9467992.1 hypothetical protein [Nakamurella leprariae]